MSADSTTFSADLALDRAYFTNGDAESVERSPMQCECTGRSFSDVNKWLSNDK